LGERGFGSGRRFLYGAGLVAVFVAARYRVVMVPWLAVAAAWAVVEGWRRLRAGQARTLRPAAAVAVAVLLLGVVPGPFAQERIDTEPEMWHGIGYDRMHRDGDLAGAEAAFREAVRLDPTYAEAQNRLGVAIGQQHRYAEAIPYFEAAVTLRPGYQEARENLALARRLAAREGR